MSKKDQEVQEVCDILVYNYLVENGHLKTAELLKKERKNFYTLESKKNEKISEILPLLITEYVELDTVSNNLIYDYLKNHENPKIQKLARKLKSLVPGIHMRGENPSIGEILSHANVSRQILVPVRKKLSNQLPDQAKTQNSFGSGEKVVPIKDVFMNRIHDIEAFKKDKPEVYRVLKCILDSDIKVMKAQADTVEIELIVKLDTVQLSNRSKSLMIEKKIKLGAFSHVRCGENSEECRIIKAWSDLIEVAQIIDMKRILQEFDNLLTKQWPCNIVGCYLSKYLEVPRSALKVFELLTRSVLYKSGKFQKEEGEIIIQHIEKQSEKKPDLNYLKAETS